jgi:nucleoid DNA-binding protein
MNKEELNKEVKEQLQTIKQHQADLTKLVEALVHVSNGDVSFAALDETKSMLEGFSEVRVAIEKSRKALKARAQARMKEG